MDLFTLDFETHYAKGYSLSGMSTEEYVRDPRFECILLGAKRNDEPTVWIDGPDVARELAKLRDKLSRSAILCHHAHFDGFILGHHYGVRPKVWFDTIAMGRALHGAEVRVSLDSLAKHYGLGAKGHEVSLALGKRRADFTGRELAEYGRYCCNDVDLTYELFQRMLPRFSNTELRTIDVLTRMFTEPEMEIDHELAERWVTEVIGRKSQLILECGVTKEFLMSNYKFADVLRPLLAEHGMALPMKVSAATGKSTYAFAKADEDFVALLEHPDDRIQTLVAARLGNKTTINETRGAKFAAIGRRGTAPVYIKYAGAAQTMRTSGGDGVNWQNLGKTKAPKARDVGRLVMTPAGWTTVDGVRQVSEKLVEYDTPLGTFNSKEHDVHLVGLRDTVRAPEGKMFVVIDSSNIEARVLSTLAGQWDAVDRFRNKVDPYCHMASHIYHREVTKEDKAERQLGKIAVLGLGYGMGAQKFQDTVKAWGAGDLDILMAKATVDAYRSTYDAVPRLWRACENALPFIAAGGAEYKVDPEGLLYTRKNEIVLPNGLAVRYPDLRKTSTGDWVFWNGMWAGKAPNKTKVEVKIYGGKVVENLVQALARIIVTEQMVQIAKRYPVKWFIHDEVVLLVDEDEAQKALDFGVAVMRQSPAWWPAVPLDAEGGVGYIYGNCK